MRKYFSYLPILIFLLSAQVHSAFSNEFIPYKYWVSFTDKEGTPYSIISPEAFLSQRALERRLRQGIAIDVHDLPVNPAYVDSLRADPQVQVYYTSRWLNGVLVSTLDDQSLQRILELPFVSDVSYVKPLIEQQRTSPPVIPDPDAGVPSEGNTMPFSFSELLDHQTSTWEQLYSGMDYGFGRRQVEQLNGQVLHRAGYWGQGKVIAVLDAGFTRVDELQAFSHLWDSGKILGYRDFVEPESDIFNTHHHGTMVLSVMGARRPGEALGTALEAGYWLLRTEDHRSEFVIEEYNWLAGAEFADSVGADIINSSLGYTTFEDPIQNHTYADLNGNTTVVARAAAMAFERGILVVNSAGNYGQQNWRYIGSPADSFGTLAVGAVDTAGVRVPFSSVGPSADGRIKPDVMAMGRRVVVTNTGGGLSLANGTSFAAPLVAGMAACLWEMFPGYTAGQIRRAITESGNRYHNPDSLMGHGIPDFARAARLIENDFEHQDYPLVLFPNPINAHSILTYYSGEEQLASIEIFDARGQLVYSMQNILSIAGYNQVQPFREASLPVQGIYMIRLSLGDQGRPQVFKAIKAW
jgi:serine protease AprX